MSNTHTDESRSFSSLFLNLQNYPIQSSNKHTSGPLKKDAGSAVPEKLKQAACNLAKAWRKINFLGVGDAVKAAMGNREWKSFVQTG